MIQTLIVISLFTGACIYIGRSLYKEWSGKGNHCADCDPIDKIKSQKKKTSGI